MFEPASFGVPQQCCTNLYFLLGVSIFFSTRLLKLILYGSDLINTSAKIILSDKKSVPAISK